MRRALALMLLIGWPSLVPPAWAAEPIVGLWRLQQQEIDGQAGKVEPLTLRIYQAGDKLTFTFSTPMNDIYFVTTTYTLRVDGSSSDILNANGQKIGTIQMTSSASGRYELTMKGPNRPESRGTLTVSADRKMLVSESDATQAGRTVHSKQTFVRS
ncbi:MAG: hypothetical protein U0Q12_15460 [Vicinamibacterales bacterium]